VNTGDSIQASDSLGGADGSRQSIYNGLPLRGGERVSLKIKGNTDKNPGLNFTKDTLYVSSITDVISETNRETFLLNLVSREAITNETSRVAKKYPTTSSIDTSVRSIISEYLQTNRIGTIDKTSNPYGFIGNLRKPFTVLVWLASKGVPDISKDATAGFVFFQTKDGFQFRSIDKLIMDSSKAEYYYSQVNENRIGSNTDFKILKYNTQRNQNLLEKLRLGTYSSYRMFYNPLTFGFTKEQDGVFKLDNYSSQVKNLGKKLDLPKISSGSNVNLGDVPTRILTQILDVGTVESGQQV